MRPLAQIVAMAGTAICAILLLIGLFGDPLRDRNRARHRAAVSQLVSFVTALERYKADCGQYPTNLDGLDALAASPGVRGWRGPYSASDIPLDPWGHPYHYNYPAGFQTPELKSYGADGKPGGSFFDADISSRNLKVVVPESPVEARGRRILIGLTVGACVGLLVSFLLWGFASRRHGNAEPEEGL